MQFKTVNLIKHGVEDVWQTMRDDLPKLAEMMDDLESITEKERTESPTVFHVVNIWISATKIPQSIKKILDSEHFVWTDRAEWNNETHVCRWTINLHHFHDSVQSHGTTIFEPAMGGNGTKVTFSGNLEWDNEKLTGIVGVFGETVLILAKDIIQNAIQKNFRKITGAIEKYLDQK